MIVITVPQLPPASQSPNSRAHYMVKHRERKDYMAMVGLSALAAGVKDCKLSKAKVGIELVFPNNRRRDSDNAGIRASKPVLDCLVNLGILQDDSAEHVTLEPVQLTVDSKRAPATVIRIQEAG